MEYRIERYKNCQRFNEQYESIYQFLLEAEKLEYNEHFHWGRFEWMHAHSYLDEDKLTSIAMFKDENGTIVGLTTYDTGYDDRVYLIHTSSDKMLLEYMVDTVLEVEGDGAVIKANSNDTVICQILQEKGFEKKHRCACILSLDLTNPLDYSMPDAYSMSPQGCVADPWQYQLVIHKGFGNEGIPERWDDEFLKRIPHVNEDLKTFAIANNEYCAHCGLWYSTGNTAYVEPVATVPEHRKQGLAKAVVYEACTRANAFGAKRAIVISDQEFYFRIGFILSSEVYDWERKN
jgi:GNAT superfamily N-acetyltransferase